MHPEDIEQVENNLKNTFKGKGDKWSQEFRIKKSNGEYMHVIDDIFIALDKQSINEDTKKDVLAILWSLKDMIISK
jgi:hemoglobin